jgi:hypothetical protein
MPSSELVIYLRYVWLGTPVIGEQDDDHDDDGEHA